MVLAIVAKNLKVGYVMGDKILWAVRGVDLAVEEGITLCIIGESGCGKSTLASTIVGTLPPYAVTSGELRIYDHVVVSGDVRKYNDIRGKLTAYIPQNPGTSLNPFMTIEDHFYHVLRSNFKIDRTKSRKIAVEILSKVGLEPGVLERYPHELSGGMQQRVLIALALATDAKILVADEPTSSIDAYLKFQIIELLSRLQRELGKTLVIITHDFLATSTMCDKIVIMYAGKIVELGAKERIMSNPRHPYTKLLIETSPILGVKKPLRPIPGEPPDLSVEITGCPFSERCPYKISTCIREPPLQEIEESHVSACWRAQEAPWA